jgi:hypothetical protein
MRRERGEIEQQQASGKRRCRQWGREEGKGGGSTLDWRGEREKRNEVAWACRDWVWGAG